MIGQKECFPDKVSLIFRGQGREKYRYMGQKKQSCCRDVADANTPGVVGVSKQCVNAAGGVGWDSREILSVSGRNGELKTSRVGEERSCKIDRGREQGRACEETRWRLSSSRTCILLF